MSCAPSQALPAGNPTVAGLNGMKGRLFTNMNAAQNLNWTFDAHQQSPYQPGLKCMATVNSACLGSQDATAPFMPATGAQMAFMSSMYMPYVANQMPTPTATALKLVKDRSPAKTCVFMNMDASRL